MGGVIGDAKASCASLPDIREGTEHEKRMDPRGEMVGGIYHSKMSKPFKPDEWDRLGKFRGSGPKAISGHDDSLIDPVYEVGLRKF